MDMRTQAETMIKGHEGFSLVAYQCSAGAWTAGWGHNLSARGITDRGPFTQAQCERWLRDDVDEAIADLAASYRWWPELSQARQVALVDMRFQFGPSRFRAFERTLAALAGRDYETAVDEILDSDYGRGVTKRRAATIAKMVREG